MWDVRSELVILTVGFQKTEAWLAADTREIVLPPEKWVFPSTFFHSVLWVAADRKQLSMFCPAEGWSEVKTPPHSRQRERERRKKERSVPSLTTMATASLTLTRAHSLSHTHTVNVDCDQLKSDSCHNCVVFCSEFVSTAVINRPADLPIKHKNALLREKH